MSSKGCCLLAGIALAVFVRAEVAFPIPESVRCWDELWDPLQYAKRCRIPTLWCTGTNDHFFPLDSFAETARAGNVWLIGRG